jgi:hypothetical protein
MANDEANGAMTVGQMNEEAMRLEGRGSKGRPALWRAAAQVCTRLDDVLEALRGWREQQQRLDELVEIARLAEVRRERGDAAEAEG